jgi:hypothetical protein
MSACGGIGGIFKNDVEKVHQLVHEPKQESKNQNLQTSDTSRSKNWGNITKNSLKLSTRTVDDLDTKLPESNKSE